MSKPDPIQSWIEDPSKNAEIGFWIRQNKPMLEAALTCALGQPVKIDDGRILCKHDPCLTLTIECGFWADGGGEAEGKAAWKIAWTGAEHDLGHTVGLAGGLGPASSFGITKAKKVVFSPIEFEAIFCNL